MGELLQHAVVGVITGVFSAGAVWGVLKTEMRYLRRDVDNAHKRLDKVGAPGVYS